MPTNYNIPIMPDGMKFPELPSNSLISDEQLIEEIPEEVRQKLKLNRQMKKEPFVRTTKKIGRNELCHCGSGKKYKKCCYPN